MSRRAADQKCNRDARWHGQSKPLPNVLSSISFQNASSRSGGTVLVMVRVVACCSSCIRVVICFSSYRRLAPLTSIWAGLEIAAITSEVIKVGKGFPDACELRAWGWARTSHSAEKFIVGLHAIGFLGDATRRTADDFYPGYAHRLTEIGKEPGLASRNSSAV